MFWTLTGNQILMKVLLVTQYFYPENFKSNDIAFELVKRGYEVTVLTGIPNYPQGCFFQAEDGIRDSSTSRGLGDVYKRQQYLY